MKLFDQQQSLFTSKKFEIMCAACFTYTRALDMKKEMSFSDEVIADLKKISDSTISQFIQKANPEIPLELLTETLYQNTRDSLNDYVQKSITFLSTINVNFDEKDVTNTDNHPAQNNKI